MALGIVVDGTWGDGHSRRQEHHHPDTSARTAQIQPWAEFVGLEHWRWYSGIFVGRLM